MEHKYHKSVEDWNSWFTFRKYEDLKYYSDDWEIFEIYCHSSKIGELMPLVKFEYYKKINNDIDNALMGCTANGLGKILGKSYCFTSEIIGREYEEKNVVEIEDIKKALQTEPELKIKYMVFYRLFSYKLEGICRVWVDFETGELLRVKPLPEKNTEVNFNDKEKEYIKKYIKNFREIIEETNVAKVLERIDVLIVKEGMTWNRRHLNEFGLKLDKIYDNILNQSRED